MGLSKTQLQIRSTIMLRHQNKPFLTSSF